MNNLRKSKLETNTYNGYNQLISRTENGKTNTYTYDIGGLRNSKTVNGVTTKQVWSMGELAMEINGADSTVKAKYYHGLTPIGMRSNDGQLYYITGHNGTVEKVTNLSGAVVADYTYDAFGNQESTSGTIYNPMRYCGEYFDEESGLIYLRNRYYDPSIGAFINEDPIRDGLNRYAYCGGNPVMFVDPWGLFGKNTLLQRGAINNPDVYKSQEKLNSLGYVGENGKLLSIDGTFGPNTEYAVRQFQKNSNGILSVDGIVGKNTWRELGLDYDGEYERQMGFSGRPNFYTKGLYVTGDSWSIDLQSLTFNLIDAKAGMVKAGGDYANGAWCLEGPSADISLGIEDGVPKLFGKLSCIDISGSIVIPFTQGDKSLQVTLSLISVGGGLDLKKMKGGVNYGVGVNFQIN